MLGRHIGADDVNPIQPGFGGNGISIADRLGDPGQSGFGGGQQIVSSTRPLDLMIYIPTRNDRFSPILSSSADLPPMPAGNFGLISGRRLGFPGRLLRRYSL